MSDMSIPRRLFWALAAATALVVGIIVVKTGDGEADPVLLGLFGLCLGGAMSMLTADAVATGRVRMRSRHFLRAERPVGFWVAVAIYGCTGGGLMLAAAYYMIAG